MDATTETITTPVAESPSAMATTAENQSAKVFHRYAHTLTGGKTLLEYDNRVFVVRPKDIHGYSIRSYEHMSHSSQHCSLNFLEGRSYIEAFPHFEKQYRMGITLEELLQHIGSSRQHPHECTDEDFYRASEIATQFETSSAEGYMTRTYNSLWKFWTEPYNQSGEQKTKLQEGASSSEDVDAKTENELGLVYKLFCSDNPEKTARKLGLNDGQVYGLYQKHMAIAHIPGACPHIQAYGDKDIDSQLAHSQQELVTMANSLAEQSGDCTGDFKFVRWLSKHPGHVKAVLENSAGQQFLIEPVSGETSSYTSDFERMHSIRQACLREKELKELGQDLNPKVIPLVSHTRLMSVDNSGRHQKGLSFFMMRPYLEAMEKLIPCNESSLLRENSVFRFVNTIACFMARLHVTGNIQFVNTRDGKKFLQVAQVLGAQDMRHWIINTADTRQVYITNWDGYRSFQHRLSDDINAGSEVDIRAAMSIVGDQYEWPKFHNTYMIECKKLLKSHPDKKRILHSLSECILKVVENIGREHIRTGYTMLRNVENERVRLRQYPAAADNDPDT